MFFIAPYYKGEESYNNMVLHIRFVYCKFTLIPQHFDLTLFISS